jgi:putative transcriptional regulator
MLEQAEIGQRASRPFIVSIMDPILNSLKGKLLLAMPGMGDPRFYKTVIFICDHDAKGSMGLIINQSILNITLGKLLAELQIEGDITLAKDIPVLTGGPVETARGFMLHTSDFNHKDTMLVTPQFSFSGTLEALKAVAHGQGPKELIFMLGYAGWGAGQLDQEIQENSWMVCNADHELLFNTPAEDKWDRAMGRIGVNPVMLSSASGHA